MKNPENRRLDFGRYYGYPLQLRVVIGSSRLDAEDAKSRNSSRLEEGSAIRSNPANPLIPRRHLLRDQEVEGSILSAPTEQ